MTAIDSLRLPLGPLPSEPLVSVLVANYNYAHFLDETIQSVLAQTYANWELVVCDDGSTDGSVGLLERYARTDARIRYVVQSNAGVAAATNAAFSESTGSVVCLLDADDRFSHTKLEAIVGLLRSSPSAGFAVHRMTMIDEHGHATGTVPLRRPPMGWLALQVLNAGGVVPDLPPCSGLSFRREVASVIFPLPPIMRQFHDRIVQRVAPLVTEVVSTAETLADYRQHGTNLTNHRQKSAAALTRSVEANATIWKLQSDLVSQLAPACSDLLRPYETSFDYKVLAMMLAAEDGRTMAALRLMLSVVRTSRFGEVPITDRLRLVPLALTSSALRAGLKRALRPLRTKSTP